MVCVSVVSKIQNANEMLLACYRNGYRIMTDCDFVGAVVAVGYACFLTRAAHALDFLFLLSSHSEYFVCKTNTQNIYL